MAADDPIDAAVLGGIATAEVLKTIRDAILDICDEVTLEGAELEDLRGELLGEADLVALVDVAGRFCADRPDVAALAGVRAAAGARYGATHQALGQVARAGDSLQ